MSEVAIDPATVQRCIEVLHGKGEYEYRRVPYSRDREDCWTYTTHPVDLLQALLPEPEKSEAEKLVDAWDGDPEAAAMDKERRNYVSLVQFVLDKVNAPNPAEPLCDMQFGDANMKSTPIIPTTGDAATVNTADPATTDSQPQYVFGPWIEWHGGKCPVPDDWEVQWLIKDETPERFKDMVVQADALSWSKAIKQYRVCFEVGKWYDWASGPRPVLPEQRVEFVQNDDWRDTLASFNISKEWWTWDCHSDNHIVRFRCVE